jgi:hypothetical protein
MPQPASAAATGPLLVTISEYARMRRASRTTIDHHCQPGGMIQLVNGRIDVEQADATWGRTRRARYLTATPGSAGADANTTAKIRRLQARLDLARHRLETRQERYAERQEAERVGIFEAEHLLKSMAALPDAKAEAFAAQLSIDVTVAQELLERFVGACLTAIGDLRGQALRAVEQSQA